MATFGSRSRAQRATLDPRIQSVLDAVIDETDFAILRGRRGKVDQNEAKATGASFAEWPDSNHNCPIPEDGVPRAEWREDPEGLSRAVDVAPWDGGIDWDDKIAFALLAGRILQEAARQGLKLKWGGHFKRLVDMPHFEIIG